MKIKELIKKLENLKEGLEDKEVFIVTKNGSLFEPSIKVVLVDEFDVLNKSSENIKHIVLKED